MILENVVFSRFFELGLVILVYVGIATLILGIIRMFSNPECRSRIKILKENYEHELEIRDKQIDELSKLLDLTKKRYENEIKQLSINIDNLRALNKALEANMVLLKCSEHPDSSVAIIPGGKLRCETGHFIGDRYE